SSRPHLVPQGFEMSGDSSLASGNMMPLLWLLLALALALDALPMPPVLDAVDATMLAPPVPKAAVSRLWVPAAHPFVTAAAGVTANKAVSATWTERQCMRLDLRARPGPPLRRGRRSRGSASHGPELSAWCCGEMLYLTRRLSTRASKSCLAARTVFSGPTS